MHINIRTVLDWFIAQVYNIVEVELITTSFYDVSRLRVNNEFYSEMLIGTYCFCLELQMGVLYDIWQLLILDLM